MKRTLLLVGPLVMVTLFCSEIRAAGQQAKRQSSWQTSWTAFVKAYNACVTGKGCNRKRFVGKDVAWEGTVTSIDLDKVGVGFNMGGPPIQDSNGATTDILAFYIKPGAGDLEKWRAVKVGDKVRFRTRTDDGITGSVLSYMPIMQSNEGKDVKMALFNATGGKLVSIVKKSSEPE